MSSIRKRNDRYQVQVRRRGYAPVSKTFTSRTAAKKWIQVTEADMERGSYAPPPSVIVSEILKRYQQGILPAHKDADVERYRLRRLNKHFGSMRLTDLTSKEVAKYRDISSSECDTDEAKKWAILQRVIMSYWNKEGANFAITEQLIAEIIIEIEKDIESGRVESQFFW